MQPLVILSFQIEGEDDMKSKTEGDKDSKIKIEGGDEHLKIRRVSGRDDYGNS